MKLNIFKIPKDKVSDLKTKLKALGLKNINSQKFGNWTADFCFSEGIDPTSIPWVETYHEFFNGSKPQNRIYYSAYIWENPKYCFVISYGKAHFYLRQFCDHDFGTEVAKRIANQKDIRQKSSKKFAGRKKKEIKSYTKNSKLDIESGESIDYLQSAIIEDQVLFFGKTGKFGSSVLLNPEIEKEVLPDFLDSLIKAYEGEELFKLPRTMVLDSSLRTAAFEEKLINEILSSSNPTDFSSNGHELVGVDFIFSGQEKYHFTCRDNCSAPVDDISMADLNNFISENSIPKDQILSIRVHVEKEDAKPFSRSLIESLDYIVDDENVILSGGKWMQFNEDYLDQLNDYIDSIDVEIAEDDLREIVCKEPDFNTECAKYGYSVADKNFTKIKVKSGTPIEAWDLKKGETVYAVKFGTAQKLGYVCDQAVNTLEVISKKANLKKLDETFRNYCVWLVIKNKTVIDKISKINSVILKQKIESWARRSYELGVTPVVKISSVK